MFSAAETLAKEPLVKKDGLKGGGYYVEYRTDDARLTIEVMKQAVEKGATPLNYSKVKNLIYKNGIVVGVLVEDLLTGEEYEVHAKKVVNATGPWVDGIREMDDSKKGKTLKLSKGVHIVIDQSRFPLKQAIYFDTPDGRMVFAIPRDGKTYVGTTDTFYNEDPINPGMTEEDRSYLLKAIHYMFPDVNVTEKDVESSWAGIRPLIHEDGKAPSEISRKDEIWESDSKLITIAGGKLTGYRKMAETIVDLLAEKFAKEEELSFPGSQTKNLPISGGDVGGSANLDFFVEKQLEEGMSAGLTKEEARRLAYQYGSNAPIVFQLASEHKKEAVQYGLPLELFAKLIYGIQYEAAATPVDFFNRRTGAILFDIDLVHNFKENVINFMRDQFSWNDQQTEAFTLELEGALTEAVVPVK
ncbi:aerobic glycerol-3-phosphate dehydrogenase [Mesobacillus boroniphilus JCM 21738]|uniref:Aerobic glycerol-3-phosphate dehydrogenase n=1 Tax=Mesobacillus boroniphilus JCM 21738 TaxID=1294265 RepID=W4RN78_9BACI|nr:aerobic glycerol-3-phosphate dehydrogenase [Mesobacillus boroniphilus JCM 21738]